MSDTPQDQGNGNAFLLGLLLTTLVLGMLVIVAKSDYRIDQIIISNEDYYTNVDVGSGSGSDDGQN
ncbi:MAG TPA: hypothetical protein PKM25_02650 [Candidatus Ozemobacteraceae bacterium]|nr:hypothetical protein [Candidatus Ozemobacteraceae bacterium]